jgi:hypothetical protein
MAAATVVAAVIALLGVWLFDRIVGTAEGTRRGRSPGTGPRQR